MSNENKNNSEFGNRNSKIVARNSSFAIIPAIDIIDGKCVRLTQGDYAQKTIYNENPLEVALKFEGNGITRLHLVDLDGAKLGKVVNYKILEKLASKTKLSIDFGGGIKTDDDIETVFNYGADLATIGSIAIKNKTLFYSWIKKFGAEKLFLGADVKGEKIAIGGWLETTNISIYDFIEENLIEGIEQVFCTDISKDGLLQGPSIDLYKNILNKFPQLNLTASGGVSQLSDLEELKKIGCSGAIIGKAIYEGRITMDQLRRTIDELRA